jgi:methionine-S-sulfoxide reductase
LGRAPFRRARTGPNATYRKHGTHAEALEITFDPDVISFRDLLEFFFQIHDPTTLNRQGNDIGLSYRSAIFYTSDEQKRVAEDTIADVEASGLWPGKVVTEVTPAGPFWEAEPEHQDYLEKYPDGYTARRRAGRAHRLRGASTSFRWWLATLLEIVLSCFDLLVCELQSDFTSSGSPCRGWLCSPRV